MTTPTLSTQISKMVRGPVWWTVEGSTALLGVRRQAVIEAGPMMLVELPEIGETFKKGDIFGSLYSVSQSVFLKMPIDCRVIAINNRLENLPDLARTDPYGEGWLIRMDIRQSQTLYSRRTWDSNRPEDCDVYAFCISGISH